MIFHEVAVATAILLRHLDDLLASADVQLDDATLDAIDDLVPPGSHVMDADLGWDPPWMSAEARRRALRLLCTANHADWITLSAAQLAAAASATD